MGSYPGGADNVELKGGLLTFTLEQFKPWPDPEPTNEIMSRISACLNSVAENEANTFAPGAKSFRIAIVYEDDPPAEVERALDNLREAASANHGVEITWGRLYPDSPRQRPALTAKAPTRRRRSAAQAEALAPTSPKEKAKDDEYHNDDDDDPKDSADRK